MVTQRRTNLVAKKLLEYLNTHHVCHLARWEIVKRNHAGHIQLVYIYNDKNTDYNHMYSSTLNALEEWLVRNFPAWRFVGVHKSGYTGEYEDFLALQVSFKGD